MAQGLLGCPFCGGKPLLRTMSVRGAQVFFVQCQRCRASTRFVGTQDRARASWNRRALRPRPRSSANA